MTIVFLFSIIVISALIIPFPNWTSYRVCFVAALNAPDVALKSRVSMMVYLLREVAMLPFHATFWVADEILYPSYHDQEVKEPVFIFSQPRSGTTFLLRTLSEDEDTFLSVKHLEWRYPYISFWKLIDLLGLRNWLGQKSYWPNTELGRTCNEIHSHVLGNYEEFGIFLEERFFHHYFVFRRFPFPPVLQRISRFESLSEADKEKMVSTFLRVIKKVYFFRGRGEVFLAKENESVEFCRAVVDRLPDARLLLICREPQPMLNSYLTMSVTCTEVKHGIDPRGLEKWHETNLEFRREQCRQFVRFWNEYRGLRNSSLVSFRDFTTDIEGSIRHIYRQFEIALRPKFSSFLSAKQAEQDQREKGYANLDCSEEGFEFYSEFVGHATQGTYRVVVTEKPISKLEASS